MGQDLGRVWDRFGSLDLHYLAGGDNVVRGHPGLLLAIEVLMSSYH